MFIRTISTHPCKTGLYTPSREPTNPSRTVDVAAEHLRAWFTPERRSLISSSALDKLAGRPVGMFSRFLARQPHIVLSRGNGLSDYYPWLALLGYQPPLPLPAQGKCNLAPFPGIIRVSGL